VGEDTLLNGWESSLWSASTVVYGFYLMTDFMTDFMTESALAFLGSLDWFLMLYLPRPEWSGE